MRKLLVLGIIIVNCSVFLSVEATANELSPREKALQALKAEDYKTAITICRSHLESDPDNYEFNFILARALAYSRQWDRGLDLLGSMLELYPQNLDLLLFRARILAWKGAFEEADAGFIQVLSLEPENKEAMIGRAEIASWKKKFASAKENYKRILALYPDDPDILYRIGRVCLWEGNYPDARFYYKKAKELDPGNPTYKKALKNAHPDFVNNFELRYQYRNEGFSDERGNYIDHHLVLGVKISQEIGFLHLKYNQTQRYSRQDSQFGVEIYPHLWQRAYGYIDLNYSPDAVHFPRASFLFEVYQSFLRTAEISMGYRKMDFDDKKVSVYLGSIGYYMGHFYPYLRWYYTPEEEGINFSWFVNVRRYFTKDSYLALGYGQGSRPFDIITIEDVSVRKRWIFLAEWDWIFLKKIHLKVQFTHRNEKDGPSRNAIFVGTGYRW